jgi:hypothetical protein
MFDFIGIHANRSWLVLLAATLVTFSISDNHAIGTYAGIATLLISYLKGRLVVLDFMELRHAPALWRGLFEAWVLIISAVLLVAYLASTHT